jgi:hypothetical protein
MADITGILDNSTQQVLVLNDDRIILRGNVTIHGVLDVGLVKTTEIISDHRYEKKFLTFVSPDDSQIAGTGLLWVDKHDNKQLVYRTNPDCFFLSEHVDLPNDKSYLIGGTPMLSANTLGGSVTDSSLKTVGTLKRLTVGGDVNIGDFVFFNPVSQRVSIGRDDSSSLFSVYDNVHDVDIILDSDENGRARIGTFNNKGLDLVTGNQTRLSLSANGNIIIGLENKDNTLITLYGKVGINVKNPKEDLEVSGNIKFQNKLFAVGNGAPAEGSFQRGDIIWNDDPMVSSYIGWVCTLGGSPGLWAPFGLIAG